MRTRNCLFVLSVILAQLVSCDGLAQRQSFTLGEANVIVYDLAVHPKERIFAAALGDKIQIWNYDSKDLLKRWTVSRILAVEFVDGKLAGVSRDGYIYLWDVTSGEELAKEKISESPFTCLALLDSVSVIAGNEAGEIIRWNVQLRKGELTIKTGVSITSIKASSRWIVTGDRTGKISLWDAGKGAPVSSFQAHKGWVRDFSIGNDEKFLVSVGDDGFVKRWKLDEYAAIIDQKLSSKWALAVDFIATDKPGSDVRAVGLRNGNVRIYTNQMGYRFHTDAMVNSILLLPGTLPKIKCVVGTHGAGIVLLGAENMTLSSK